MKHDREPVIQRVDNGEARNARPWALSVGAVVVALALLAAVASGQMTWPLLLVGVILVGVGLVQQSIEKRPPTP